MCRSSTVSAKNQSPVEGNLIKQISREAVNVPGAMVIDGAGRTLMPGLIEGHGHLQMNGASLADIENNLNWEELAIRSAVNAEAKSGLMQRRERVSIRFV
jgi:imidazolonepropionase-like amidohydrolase